jgi:hypothetical protein
MPIYTDLTSFLSKIIKRAFSIMTFIIRHSDNDTQHYGTHNQRNDTQHNIKKRDTQHNGYGYAECRFLR